MSASSFLKNYNLVPFNGYFPLMRTPPALKHLEDVSSEALRPFDATEIQNAGNKLTPFFKKTHESENRTV